MDKELEKQCIEALEKWENAKHPDDVIAAGSDLYGALDQLLQFAQGA